jgi:hypothetical protein
MLQNEEISCKVMLGHYIGGEMNGACHTCSGEGAYHILVEIPTGKKPQERISNGREGNRVMFK